MLVLDTRATHSLGMVVFAEVDGANPPVFERRGALESWGNLTAVIQAGEAECP